MKLPLQVWLPYLDPMATNEHVIRDIERAQRAWEGERTIWILPGIPETLRWTYPTDEGFEHLAINGERLSRIDVVFVGTNGEVAEDANFRRFGSTKASELLDSWLSILQPGAEPWAVYEASTTARLDLPYFCANGSVKLVERTVELEPLSLQHLEFNPETGMARSRWPPEGWGLPEKVISANAESLRRFGGFRGGFLEIGEKRMPIYINQYDPTLLAFSHADKWPGILEAIFPAGGGLDAGLAQKRCRKAALLSQEDLEGALEYLHQIASGHSSPSRARRLDSWFAPQLQEKGLGGVLFEIEGRFGLSLDASTLHESAEFVELIHEKEATRRCRGALGLFAALLIDELENNQRFLECQRCGKVLRGTRKLQFCRRKDDPECWRSRRREDKKRERERKRR